MDPPHVRLQSLYVCWRCFSRLALYVNRSSALIIHARKKPLHAWCLCPLELSNWHENPKRWEEGWMREIQSAQEDRRAHQRLRDWGWISLQSLLPRHCTKTQQLFQRQSCSPKIWRRLLTFCPRADHDDLLLWPWVRHPESRQLWEEERLSCSSQPQAEPAIHLHPQATASPADGEPGGLLQLLHPALKHRKDQDQVPQSAWQREEKPHQEHGQSEWTRGEVFLLGLCVIG